LKRSNAKKKFLKQKQNIRIKSERFLFVLQRKFFLFVSKITLLKRSEKLEAKRSENIELNFLSEQAKHMRNSSKERKKERMYIYPLHTIN
jgi:hypothetical protein